MKSFEQKVADWARAKPADEAYDNWSRNNCAIAQFLRETGQAAEPLVGGFHWRDGEDGERHPYSTEMVDHIHTPPLTFGALADRLSS